MSPLLSMPTEIVSADLTINVMIQSSQIQRITQRHSRQTVQLQMITKKVSDLKRGHNKDVNLPDDGVQHDTGWAWMVAFASWTFFLIYIGYYNVIGVLLLDLSAELDVHIESINFMLSMCGITYCVSTLVSTSFLAERFPLRVMLTLASITNCGASLVFAFVPSFPVFVSMHIIKYVASGMCSIPSLSLVAYYFRRHRSLACSLAIMGLNSAGIIVPPLTRYLKDEYGLQGCFVLLSGFEMHAVVASLLCRPITNSSKEKKTKESGDVQNRPFHQITSPTVASSTCDQNYLVCSKEIKRQDCSKSEVFVVDDGKQNTEIISNIPPNSSSQNTAAAINVSSLGPSNSTRASNTKSKSLVTTFLDRLQPVFDIRFLLKPLSLMCLAYYSLIQSGVPFLVFLPSIATKAGISTASSALLLTYNGVAEIVSKILFPFVSELCGIRSHTVVAFTAVIFGVFINCGPILADLELLLVVAIVHGFISEVGAGLFPAVVVEMLGLENLNRVVGTGSSVATIGQATQYAILGVLIETTGSFDPVFYYCGVVYPIAGLLLLLEPIIRRLHEAKH